MVSPVVLEDALRRATETPPCACTLDYYRHEKLGIDEPWFCRCRDCYCKLCQLTRWIQADIHRQMAKLPLNVVQ